MARTANAVGFRCWWISAKRALHSQTQKTIKCPPLISLDSPDIWVPSSTPKPPSFTVNDRTAAILDGRTIAKEIRSKITAEVRKMSNSVAKTPGLGVVLVGKRRDSRVFVSTKLKACKEVGIESVVTELPENCEEVEVCAAVARLNEDPQIHGIIVQLPLPKHVNEEKIMNFVCVEKDVDGFHPLNIGNLALQGREPLFIPCATRACIELLLRHGVVLKGTKVAVIGRSKIAGLPTSLLLQRHHATVSVIHAFTKDPEKITREADVVVSDVGVPNMVRGHWLKPGAVVIDIGTNSVKDDRNSSGYRLVGDVCYEEACVKVSAITPVPGGVGPVTISMLLSNTLDSAKRFCNFT